MSSLLSNVANSKLVSAITGADTVITITGGTGSLFPALSGEDTFNIVLEDAAKNIEICKVLERDGDVFTVERGQEFTTPRIYDIGDRVSLRMTAGAFNSKEDKDEKDHSDGYVGLTQYKIRFKSSDGAFVSLMQNNNTADRTYTFQNRNGTIADLADLALKSNLDSPTFTGTPAAPTAAPGTNTTQVATTAFVLANNFPTGTRMTFNQTAAPLGWVKDTDAALNDSVLRIVTGTVGSGGANGFSAFNAQTTVGNTTLTVAQMPSHRHSIGPLTVSGNVNASGSGTRWNAATDVWSTNQVANTNFEGGGEAHTHAITTNIKYSDFIIATKG
jgi:hypothetical protein